MSAPEHCVLLAQNPGVTGVIVIEPGFHARDKLAALLWSESDQAAGRASLRTALAQINSELGGLLSNRDAVAWTADHLELDVHRLERVFRAIGTQAVQNWKHNSKPPWRCTVVICSRVLTSGTQMILTIG